MTMYRINAAWQNWPGAPGVTTFFQNPAIAQPNPGAIRTFFEAMKTALPAGLTVTVPGSGDLIEESNGQIAGAWSATPAPLPTTMQGAGAYAGNAGSVVHWLTTTVVNGRRVRGRSFLVPVVMSGFETNGSLTPSMVDGIRTAAQALVDTTPGHLVVWHRPRKATPTQPASVGSFAAVTGVRVPDLAISLRSRRV